MPSKTNKTRVQSNEGAAPKSPPRRIPAISSRAVTPGRSNKRGVDDAISALLTLDIHKQAPLPKVGEDQYERSQINLVDRSIYNKYSSKKINHRFYYLRKLRCEYNKSEWKAQLLWAQNFAKDNPERLERNESEFSMREWLQFDGITLSQLI